MPKIQPKPGTSRQRPVSCQFCRTRKLRCSRTAPCSNCVSRGVTCDLETSVPQPISSSKNTSSNSDNSEIIERLQRLENLLVAQKEERRGQDGQASDVSSSCTHPIQPSISPVYTHNMDIESDSAWGRNAYISTATKFPETRLLFKTCPVRQITKAQSFTWPQELIEKSVAASQPTRCIWLPQRAETQILVEKFVRIDYSVPNVTHTPSLISIVDEIYQSLDRADQLSSGHIILLLSILAAATHFWVESDCAYGLFPTAAEANEQVLSWINAAEDVLVFVRRSTKISMEGVQGILITTHIAALIEGLQRYRILFTTAVALAQELGLHRIDHPSNAGITSTVRSEIGRRVWWHICASDWSMAARIGGMLEGIYSCHPRQMVTRKPLNIDDAHLFDGMGRDEQPLSYPTTMSYTNLSIRLAEISRSIVDRSPLTMANMSSISHDTIMDIDTEMQTFINDIPAFFSLSKFELMETYKLTDSESKNIVVQGKMARFSIYLQRCKLHLPYLARSFDDTAYSLSREICTKYARLIIQSELWQENSDLDPAMLFKFTGLLVGAFLACIVMLMDVCAKPSSPQYEQQRAEVHKAFKLVEAAKNESETTGKLVESLISILRKYNTNLVDPMSTSQKQQLPRTNSQQLAAIDVHETPSTIAVEETSDSGNSHGQLVPVDDLGFTMGQEDPFQGDGDLALFWNDFTQSFDQGMDVDTFDWDKIFSELDTSFI